MRVILLLIFRDDSAHRNIELPNASRRDRNGTIGVCVPFTAFLLYPPSQSPIIELLTPRDSFESLVANKHFLVGVQIPSLARSKNNVSFFPFFFLFTDKLCVHYTFPSVFQLSPFLSHVHTRAHTRTHTHTHSLSLSLFFLSFSFSPSNIR